MAPSDLNVTHGQTLWHHRAVKIRRQIIADIIGITDILSGRYRYMYMAHHYSLAIRQAFWKLPDVTHFPSPPPAGVPTSYGINNIRLRHEYAKHLSAINGRRHVGGPSTTHRRLAPLPKEPSRISLMYLIFLETIESFIYIFPPTVCVYLYSIFFWWAPQLTARLLYF